MRRSRLGFNLGLMAAHRYPDLVKHSKEHQVLVRTLADFRNKFEAGLVDFTSPVMPFLEDWFVDHMMRMDKPMGEFILAARAPKQKAARGIMVPA